MDKIEKKSGEECELTLENIYKKLSEPWQADTEWWEKPLSLYPIVANASDL